MKSCFALLLSLFFVGQLLAHPGGHGQKAVRTWTLADGTVIQGSLLTAQDQTFKIEQSDGTVTAVETKQLSEADRQYVAERQASVETINRFFNKLQFVVQQKPMASQVEKQLKAPTPAIAEYFKPFEKTLELRWDEQFFYVGSNGMPDHRMMVGITAWQQQVPLPQKYFGNNAWRIPLHPVPAKEPALIKGRFLRGAIALAVNGIPIFNPQNNRGEVSYEIGELDEFGGHCGRADDYHYHLAPVHLEKIVGPNQPIAYALDGFPIYGYQDEKSPDYAPLDSLSGHKDKAGKYHYHATKKYPYVIGGFYGEVVEREGQVDPQPHAGGVRPALQQLRDAKITDFVETKPNSYRLTYEIRSKKGTVSYDVSEDGSAKFVFVDPAGQTTSESYTPRKRGPGGNDRPPPPPRPGENPPPRRNEPSPPPPAKAPAAALPANVPQLKLSSASVDDKGFLSIDCTCSGKGESPAIAWKDVPAGTKFLAVTLWHTAPDQEKSYWLVYNIPANVSELKQNEKTIGQLGKNGKGKVAYDPMCSKGPGVKDYHITVYALSEEPKLTAEQATRPGLLAAIKDITLATGTLTYKYERK